MVASTADAEPSNRRALSDVPATWRTMLAIARTVVAGMGKLSVSGGIPAALRRQPLLLAANHIGVFDPCVLMAACRQIGIAPRFLLAAGLLDAPVLGPALRASGHVRVDRSSPTVAAAFDRSITALRASSTQPLLVYPEGRISLDEGLWPERGKTGAVRLALAAGVTVVPISQWGAHEAVHWGTETVGGFADIKPLLGSALSSPARRPTFRVHFGEPIDLSPFEAGKPGDAVKAHAVLMRAITENLRALRPDEPDVPRHHDPTRPTTGKSPWR